jgi:hypothetical protein
MFFQAYSIGPAGSTAPAITLGSPGPHELEHGSAGDPGLGNGKANRKRTGILLVA